MIGGAAELVALVSQATAGSMSPDEILDTDLRRLLQLRSAAMLREGVRLRPAGGSPARRQVMEALGEWAGEWLEV